MEKDINCLIKVVAEKRHIGKWLADTIEKILPQSLNGVLILLNLVLLHFLKSLMYLK